MGFYQSGVIRKTDPRFALDMVFDYMFDIKRKSDPMGSLLIILNGNPAKMNDKEQKIRAVGSF